MDFINNIPDISIFDIDGLYENYGFEFIINDGKIVGMIGYE